MRSLLHQPKNAGFTLPEMLVYIALVVIIVVVTTTAVLNFALIIDLLKTRSEMVETAHGSLERLTREVRNAESVDLLESDLLIATSTLALVGDGYTTTIAGSTTALMVARDSAAFVSLTPSDMEVTEFYVYRYQSASDVEAIRFVMTLTANSSRGTITETFNASAVLRGSYE